MKTKLISYISLLVVLTMGGVVCGCNDNLLEKRNEKMSKGCITVEEAKSYFEQAMQQVSVTRGGKDDFLIPGDFKPTWSNPTTTTYGNISCMNLPITSFMRYGAKYKQHLRGKDRDKIVDLSQKLIILKNTDTGEMSQYLVTLVPCFGYARAHRGDDIAELFVQGGDKHQYSGMVLYSIPQTGTLFQIDTYVNGHRTGSANCLTSGRMRQNVMMKALMRLEFRGSVCTRDFGFTYEDFWGLDSGSYYPIDTDGDGYSDSWGYNLPDLTVTPDGNDNYGDGGGDGFDYSDIDEENSQNNNDWDYDDCYFCGGGSGGGSNGNNSGNDCIGRVDYSDIGNKNISCPVKAYPGYGNGLDCLGVAKKIMDYYGIKYETKRVQLWKEDEVTQELKPEYTDAYEFKKHIEAVIDEVIRHIDAGRVMIAGVDHSPGHPGNGDKTTDHFIVITGYGYGYNETDGKDELYFTYIETARTIGYADAAVSASNKLYYNDETNMISGYRYDRERFYELVQVRPNF